MKQFKLFLSIAGILALCFQTFAQQGGNGPERFYNVESYKANITLTFSYQFVESEPGYHRSVSASQRFQHFITTAPGQMTGGDMFQLERGDKGDNEAQEGDILEGIDMGSVAKALKNSGVDPSVMDKLRKTKAETQSYHLGSGKYKMWGFNGVTGGEVSSSIYSKFSDEQSGTMSCGEGDGGGTPFKYDKNYTGSSHDGFGSLFLQLNLVNNSYSFTAAPGVLGKFTGNDHHTQCGITKNEPISWDAFSFISISTAKNKSGLIYKKQLPESGMVFSGSEVITDRFNLKAATFPKEGNWSVRIDWSIYPSDM